MNTLLENMGLVCLAVQNSGEDVGRTKLQKMGYFADRYMGWDVGDYSLHYYGPFSRNLITTLKAVREELVDETRLESGLYQYGLTPAGTKFLDEFVGQARDGERMLLTRELFAELSAWSRDDLELASTIDYVKNKISGASDEDVLDKVGIIKENFNAGQIRAAYELWSRWKKEHGF